MTKVEEAEGGASEQLSKAAETTPPPQKKRNFAAPSAKPPAQSSLARFLLGTAAGMVMGLAGVIYLSSSAAGESAPQATATAITQVPAKPSELIDLIDLTPGSRM